MTPHIIDFRSAESFDEVAGFLSLKPALLRAVISAGRNPDKKPALYVRHRIPKRRRTGQVRTVWDIDNPQIRDAHRAFAWRFEDFAKHAVTNFPHPAAYGYVRGRSIKDNAARHAGAKTLLRCDLKDFFGTITYQRLVNRFSQMGIQDVAAQTLAGFVTIEGTLALGLNASPVLANLVCSALDTKLETFATEHSCRYTRYADDISISGDTIPPTPGISSLIEAEGFQLAAGKFRITKLGQAHFVTGLSISDPSGPHVPRNFKRRLRQELYYCDRYGTQSHLEKVAPNKSYQKEINRLDGSVRFVSAIEPTLGARLQRSWRKRMAVESIGVSYSPVHDKAGVRVTFLIDETEFNLASERFLAIACVTTTRIDTIRAHVMTTLRKHLVDPFAPGRKKALKARGLHFADAPEDLRTEYIQFLNFLPLRAYLAFGHLDGQPSYSALYLSLLTRLLAQRFRSYDRSTVTILAEHNPQVPEAAVGSLISQVYRDLESRDERRPLLPPQYSSKSKLEEPAFSLPDALLWVFRRAFAADEGAGELDYLRFERIRDKYRHIVNIDTQEFFSRRHPIEVRRKLPR